MCMCVGFVMCRCLVIYILYPKFFPFFFLNCKANLRVKFAKTGYDPHPAKLVVICVVLCVVCVYICTVILSPSDNPIAVNRYIIFTCLTTSFVTRIGFGTKWSDFWDTSFYRLLFSRVQTIQKTALHKRKKNHIYK